jgi:hypothetical protein
LFTFSVQYALAPHQHLTEETDMSADPIRGRYDTFFQADFMPLIRHDQTQGAEERSAYADEFAAYHLGQIDKKLGRLIELMEQAAGSRT